MNSLMLTRNLFDAQFFSPFLLLFENFHYILLTVNQKKFSLIILSKLRKWIQFRHLLRIIKPNLLTRFFVFVWRCVIVSIGLWFPIPRLQSKQIDSTLFEISFVSKSRSKQRLETWNNVFSLFWIRTINNSHILIHFSCLEINNKFIKCHVLKMLIKIPIL